MELALMSSSASSCVSLSSLFFSCLVVSDSLWPHGLQHARLPCPSPSPGVCSHSHPFSQWCHPTISSSVTPVPSCPQSLPASGSFPMSQLFTFSFSISPSNDYSGSISFRMDWLDLLAVWGILKSLLQHYSSKTSILRALIFCFPEPLPSVLEFWQHLPACLY